MIGVATGIVVDQYSDDERSGAAMWSTLGPVIGGVTSLVIKSDEERRYETYLRAKEGILAHTSNTEISVGFVPLPRGGMFGLLVRF